MSFWFGKTNSSCKAVISEINGDIPTNQPSKMFIELEFVCSAQGDTVQASGYQILIINGNKGKMADVELYAQLKDFTTDSRQFYTLGEDSIDHPPNMAFSDRNVFYRAKLMPKNQRTLFPSGAYSAVPRAVLLLHATGVELSTLINKLRHINTNVVKIDDTLKLLLKKTMKDMIVYGRKSSYNKCLIFEELHEPLQDAKLYMLRDINKADTTDSSLNRCSEVPEPYQFRYFKIGKTTPGRKNDCSGAFFFLEEAITRQIPPSSERAPINLEEPQNMEENVEGKNTFYCFTFNFII